MSIYLKYILFTFKTNPSCYLQSQSRRVSISRISNVKCDPLRYNLSFYVCGHVKCVCSRLFSEENIVNLRETRLNAENSESWKQCVLTLITSLFIFRLQTGKLFCVGLHVFNKADLNKDSDERKCFTMQCRNVGDWWSDVASRASVR